MKHEHQEVEEHGDREVCSSQSEISQCLPQNGDCLTDTLKKIFSVIAVALNAATDGVFGDQGIIEIPSRPHSSKKIYPVGKEGDRKHGLVKTKGLIAGVVCVCQAWTIWLILLNVSPNRTVNRVMRTETFDYGSFWLFIDPSKTLVVMAALGLSIVAAGYLSILVKMFFCVEKSTKHIFTRQPTSKINVLSKVGSSLHDTVASSTRGPAASATIALAVSITQPASAASKLILLAFLFYNVETWPRMTGLYPTDTTNALFVDMITDTFIELNGPLYGACFCLDAATKHEKIDVFLATSLPKYFAMLEKTVRGKFFLGEQLSLADFLLFDASVYLIRPNMPAFDLSTYPKLDAIVSEVMALPTLKEYLSKTL